MLTVALRFHCRDADRAAWEQRLSTMYNRTVNILHDNGTLAGPQEYYYPALVRRPSRCRRLAHVSPAVPAQFRNPTSPGLFRDLRFTDREPYIEQTLVRWHLRRSFVKRLSCPWSHGWFRAWCVQAGDAGTIVSTRRVTLITGDSGYGLFGKIVDTNSSQAFGVSVFVYRVRV